MKLSTIMVQESFGRLREGELKKVWSSYEGPWGLYAVLTLGIPSCASVWYLLHNKNI